MRTRSRARAWALQVLYAWEMREAETPILQVLADFMEERHIAQASQAYLRRVLVVISENLPAIDHALEQSLDNWRLHRLSAIDRNVLRIAVAELLCMDDIPPPVSIQEAIVLAEKFGAAESPRFVNGVLDGVRRRSLAPRGGAS
ncbi:MAG: transcription antitermination factor NusB [Gemmatimonadetes bacterium]|nr:transcription antitermination factor NusB [Gemmatimonadota bacterium]